jgi:DNA-binding CsgD family transcriptional regulator/tetratricopeptide (TPR) repeat protein
MRATIAWSYQLLAPEEQQLFRWLAVFTGGCILEAIEAIARPAGLGASHVLDGVSVLLENHLLRQVEQQGGEPRLLMLETIREFGLECLQSCGELEAARTAHATYYLALAEEAEPQIRGAEHGRWVAHFEREQENLRAALGFLLEQARTQAGTQQGVIQVERILRLCVALWQFWNEHGSGREGLSFLMSALTEHAGVGAALRARALGVAASLAFSYARHLPLEQMAEESLAIYQELGDPVGIANSLYQLGSIARIRSQFVQAQAHLEEAAARFQALGDRWRQGRCSTEWARAAIEQGQYDQTQARLSESLVLYQELGDPQRIAWVRYLLAHLLFVRQEDQALARQLAEQSLAQFRELGDTPYRAFPLGQLGLIQLEQDELEAARPLLEESLVIGKQMGAETETVYFALGLAQISALEGGAAAARRQYRESLSLLLEVNVYKEGITASLEGLAALEAEQGRPRQAVWLWGAAHALREAIGAPIYPVSRASYEHALAQACAQLGEQVFRAAWAEGRLMPPEQAVAAQEQAMTPTTVPAGAAAARLPARPSPFGLTARELDVLRLLAQGLSDAQIAEQLVIARRTVNWYLTSIYSKLGVSSRAAATRSALEQHLV